MTNTTKNISFQLLNALNEFESFGLHDNASDSPEFENIFVAFDQLRSSISALFDTIDKLEYRTTPKLKPRQFKSESDIRDFKHELEQRLNIGFDHGFFGHEFAAISFTHFYDYSYDSRLYDAATLEHTDIFDLIGYFLQSFNDQLIIDLESASYYLNTGENRD